MMEMYKYFSVLEDPRDVRGLRHELGNIIVMSIYAILCNCTDAENMAYFMKLQEPYFKKLLDLKYGVPSADTLLRVFALIEPEDFMEAFYSWIHDVLNSFSATKNNDIQRIAIDGKAVRAASEKRGSIPYIISAYLENYGISIGQLKVGEKTNEITEIPRLLKKLDIENCVITIDAIGCQKQIAKQIVEQKGHYCLAVKTNQKILHDEIREYFDYAEKEGTETLNIYQTAEKDHGRIEIRKYTTSTETDFLTGKKDWKNLKRIGKVECIRETDGKKSRDIRYYIMDEDYSAQEMATVVRGHWEIENKLHWILDVHFKEDFCKIKERKAMENIALIRKICYNLIKLDSKFDRKKKMTYKKMSMMYQYDLRNIENLVVNGIGRTI